MLRNAFTRTLQNVQKFSTAVLSRSMASYGDIDEPRKTEKSINSITLIGRCGADAILRQTLTNSSDFVIFPMATRTSNIGPTQWHRIIVFSESLIKNVASNVVKGDRIYIKGRLTYRTMAETNMKEASIVAEEIINFTRKYLQKTSPMDEEEEVSREYDPKETVEKEENV